MGVIRKAEAQWTGDLMNGAGTLKLSSGAYEGPYNFKGRTTNETSQTNPEELIAAAHAGCYSMALSALLSKANHPPKSIHTIANVHLDSNTDGFYISGIDLTTEASVPGLTSEEFLVYANTAKENCPVSKALKAIPITFKATLMD